MNETQTTYPEWQKTIRAAQIKRQAEQIIEQQDIDKLNAEINAKAGKNLARILKLAFGIEVFSPITNELILDGFKFWFSNFNEVTDDGPTRLFFNLYVYPVKPENIDWDDWMNAACFEVRGKGLDEDWTTLHANLANEMDRMAFAAEQIIQQHKQQQMQKANPLTKKPTIEGLIRAIVREVMAESSEF